MTKTKSRVKAATSRKVVLGWLLAPLALILISILIALLWPRPANAAKADSWYYMEPYVFLGLDATLHGGVVCYNDAANSAEANLGVGLTIVRRPSWEVAGQWTHHSCAFDEDRETYDGFGAQLRWYPARWRW